MKPPLSAELIASQRSSTLVRLFSAYLRYYFSRNFHAVRILKSAMPVVDKKRPMVVYSNHPSWWDPLFFFVLSAAKFHGRMAFGAMDAAALENYPIFKRLGIFGIDPDSLCGAKQFLSLAKGLVANPNHCLWITAQGEFTDIRCRPVALRSGVVHLSKHFPDLIFLPLALEYSFWNESYPEALAAFGEPISAESFINRSRKTQIIVLEDRMRETMDRLAGAAMQRDPMLFEEIIRGNFGTGGIYHFVRRFKAIVLRQNYRAEHGRIKQ